MPYRSVVLTGAPRPSTLDWEGSHILQQPIPFVTPRDSRTSEPPPLWRAVGPLLNLTEELNIGQRGSEVEEASFFTGGNINRYSGQIVNADETTLLEFYDHSFALHEGIGSFSQSGSGSFNDTSDDSLWNDSVNESVLDPKRTSHDDAATKGSNQPGVVRHLSDLEDLPDAPYIQSITPRIITTNLVVAVMDIRPRHRIRTHWGRERDLVEVLVGDETRSGFRFTCWLPASGERPSKTPLEHALNSLRPRDIVLLRSVALSSFRGQVYGQSLRDNMTRIDLLSRKPVDSGDAEGAFKWKLVAQNSDNNTEPLLSKVRKVRQWILNFVGPGYKADSALPAPARTEAGICLPPDTQ